MYQPGAAAGGDVLGDGRGPVAVIRQEATAAVRSLLEKGLNLLGIHIAPVGEEGVGDQQAGVEDVTVGLPLVGGAEIVEWGLG